MRTPHCGAAADARAGRAPVEHGADRREPPLQRVRVRGQQHEYGHTRH